MRSRPADVCFHVFVMRDGWKGWDGRGRRQGAPLPPMPLALSLSHPPLPPSPPFCNLTSTARRRRAPLHAAAMWTPPSPSLSSPEQSRRAKRTRSRPADHSSRDCAVTRAVQPPPTWRATGAPVARVARVRGHPWAKCIAAPLLSKQAHRQSYFFFLLNAPSSHKENIFFCFPSRADVESSPPSRRTLSSPRGFEPLPWQRRIVSWPLL